MNLQRVSSGWSAQTRRDFWGLTGAIALVGFALGTVLPLTALRLEQIGHGSGVIGSALALHAAGLVLAMPMTRLAAVHIGTRRTLTLASLGAAWVCITMQDTRAAPVMAMALLVLGMLLGLVFNLAEAWVNDILPEAARGRWLAAHCTVFTCCQLVGPALLPALPTGHEYRISGLLLLLALPACRMLSQRDLVEADHEPSFQAWWQIVVSAPSVVCGTALFALFDAVVLGILPHYARQLGTSHADALIAASVVLAGDAALEWVIGALADRYGRLRVQVLCGLVLLAGAPMLPLLIGHSVWWALLFIIGGAAGGIYVLSLMACGQRFAGRRLLQVTSLLGASWGAASCGGPLLTGWLMQAHLAWSLPAVIAFSALGQC